MGAGEDDGEDDGEDEGGGDGEGEGEEGDSGTMAQAESARLRKRMNASLETFEQILDTLDHSFQRPQSPMNRAVLLRRVLGKKIFLQG